MTLHHLAGAWQLEMVQDGRTMLTARTTTSWLGGLLHLHTDPPQSIAPEWEGLAPETTDLVLGHDDFTGRWWALYSDARGVRRQLAMTLDGDRWTLEGRPGETFFQRFAGTVGPDRIEGRWERSEDGDRWETDMDVVYTRRPR